MSGGIKMNESIVKEISTNLNITENQVNVTLQMLSEGNTIPFIARYRKDKTGGLSEEEIKVIGDAYDYQVNLLKRKEDVIRLIDEKGLLTDELKSQITNATKLVEVEDLYRPYKEKKKTKATEAIKNGLEPLAKMIMSCPSNGDIKKLSERFINENVKDDIENYSKEKKKVIMPEMYPVGLAKGTYIICHNELGIYMIDQHAAKERINYEGYLKAFGNPLKGSIKMLVPLTLEFPSNEFIIIKQNIDVLKDMHFDIEESGINSFTIKEHPTWIKEGYEVESIKKVIEVLISEEKHFSIEKFREKAAIMLSCKMAIKANMNISMEEMEALINDLRKCDNPYTCPHGRPTTIFYSNYELEKMFKRAM